VSKCDLNQPATFEDHQAFPMEWQTIITAPFGRDLELAVIDASGPHTLVFPCQRILCGWVNSATKTRVNVHPTHWREWPNRAVREN
jgi:hypothetical protein